MTTESDQPVTIDDSLSLMETPSNWVIADHADDPNVLVFRSRGDEGVRLRFGADEESYDDYLALWATSFVASTGSSRALVFTWATKIRTPGLRDYSVAEMIALIRSVLSANVTEMASILRVERPTVYAWASGRTLPHGDNVRRLQKIFQFAAYVMGKTAVPLGKLIREPSQDGLSIVSLLSEETIHDERVYSRFRVALEKIEAAPKRSSIIDRAIKRGSDPSRDKNNRDVTDWITGKRIEPETDL